LRNISLKAKLLLWFGGITAVILLLFSFFFYYYLNTSINENIETRLEQKAIDIEESSLTKHYPKEINFAIYDINASLINKSASFDLKGIKPYLNQKKNFFILANQDFDENINVLYIYKTNKHIIAIYQKEIDNKIEDLVSSLLILNPILLLAFIYLASKIIDKILDPVKNVIAVSKNISIDDFATTIELPKEHDEIRELVDSFNGMRLRLKTGVESIERFNSDVSHELKTPLTVILGEVEVTLRRIRSSQEYIKSMQVVYNEAKQMQKIVQSMLLLTKFTRLNVQETYEECNISRILADSIEKFSNKADSKKIRFHLDIRDKIVLKANPVLIGLVFSNLIDNAIKYSDTDKNIFITLYQDSKVHFLIRDEGIGISEQHLNKISDRFYRVDESRSKKVEGFGLGLFIVKHILDLHEGTMHIVSKPEEGTSIEILL
jgi:signal transduction histidine kinase